jgi:SM-20-related protein
MEEKYEPLIQGILDHNFSTAAHFFDEKLVKGLRGNLLHKHNEGAMHPAGIGKQFSFQKNLKVRGDLICWLDEHSDDAWECQFLQAIDDFVQYLNRTCFAGIKSYEFHYAFYETGSFYRRHLDQFQQDKGRQFSVVSYLNEDWKPGDGGELVLYLPDGVQTVFPEGGRVVFFKSDEIEHEVKPALRDRLSIAGWLKVV